MGNYLYNKIYYKYINYSFNFNIFLIKDLSPELDALILI